MPAGDPPADPETLRAQLQRCEEALAQRLTDVDALGRRLIDAEQRAGAEPGLRARIAELEAAVRSERDATEAARRHGDALGDQLAEARQREVDLTTSPSWRVTRPLRIATRLAARRPGGGS